MSHDQRSLHTIGIVGSAARNVVSTSVLSSQIATRCTRCQRGEHNTESYVVQYIGVHKVRTFMLLLQVCHQFDQAILQQALMGLDGCMRCHFMLQGRLHSRPAHLQVHRHVHRKQQEL